MQAQTCVLYCIILHITRQARIYCIVSDYVIWYIISYISRQTRTPRTPTWRPTRRRGRRWAVSGCWRVDTPRLLSSRRRPRRSRWRRWEMFEIVNTYFIAIISRRLSWLSFQRHRATWRWSRPTLPGVVAGGGVDDVDLDLRVLAGGDNDVDLRVSVAACYDVGVDVVVKEWPGRLDGGRLPPTLFQVSTFIFVHLSWNTFAAIQCSPPPRPPPSPRRRPPPSTPPTKRSPQNRSTSSCDQTNRNHHPQTCSKSTSKFWTKTNKDHQHWNLLQIVTKKMHQRKRVAVNSDPVQSCYIFETKLNLLLLSFHTYCKTLLPKKKHLLLICLNGSSSAACKMQLINLLRQIGW